MIPLLVAAVVQSGEVYGRLASAIPETEWKEVELFFEGSGAAPSFVPLDATRLATQKAVALRWAGILAGLRQASEVAYVPGKVEPSQALRLAKLVSHAARERFADGDRHAAVTLLLDGLTMARRTRFSDGEGVILRSFAENMSGIPLVECGRVRSGLDSLGGTSVGLRLLRAHMRIEAYRWQWLKLPAALKDAMPAAEGLDGEGRPFRFQQTAGGYTLETARGRDGVAWNLAGPIRSDTERN